MNGWHDFHFLRPYWLLALPVLWAAVYALARWRERDGNWTALIDADLLAGLRLHDAQRAGRSPWPWLLLAWTLATLALAGPSWQRAPSAGFRGDSAWVLVLDMSPSMLATDIAPDRATRARYAIDDLLAAAQDKRVGLVVFGGEDYTVTPLTDDVATIRALLPSLSPVIMPVAGDNLAPALRRAGKLLTQGGVRHGRIVVLSDGFADPAAAFGAAAKLRGAGDATDVVGIGTRAGAPMPGGSFRFNAKGRLDMTKLDVDGLRQLASSGGGRYVGLDDLHDLIGTLQSVDHDGDITRAAHDVKVEHWLDGGIWLLPLLLLVAAVFGRRGWL